MKKFIYLILSMAFVAPIYAQNNKAKEKAQKKEYKNKIKDYRKKGYEITGTARSLEVSLLEHYEKLGSGKYEALTVTSQGCPTINLCSRKSLADATSEYASMASSFVKGRVTSAGGFDASEQRNDKTDQDKFFAAYEQTVSANVSNMLKKSFAVVRKKGKTYDYESYYLIENEEARKARMNALEQAQAETEANVEWGETVSDFVNQAPIPE